MSKTTQAKKAVKAEQKELTAVEETTTTAQVANTESQQTPESAPIKIIKKAGRSKNYLAAKKKLDVSKYYPLSEAIKLSKEISTSKFVGSLEAHLVTLHNPGNIGEISFPYLKAASKNIVIVNEAIIAEIKEGKINFDILVATPATMPKLLPLAKVLGPKGLMPNPKNGTLTDHPEEAVKKLSVAKQIVKTEKSAPVIHVLVGKLDQPDSELTANIEELIKVVNPTKLKKLVLSPSMGPGIKIQL